jgi:hypothetical protein
VSESAQAKKTKKKKQKRETIAPIDGSGPALLHDRFQSPYNAAFAASLHLHFHSVYRKKRKTKKQKTKKSLPSGCPTIACAIPPNPPASVSLKSIRRPCKFVTLGSTKTIGLTKITK